MALEWWTVRAFITPFIEKHNPSREYNPYWETVLGQLWNKKMREFKESICKQIKERSKENV